MSDPSVTTNIPVGHTTELEPNAAVLTGRETPDPAITASIDQFESLYSFPLDDFQRNAIEAFERGDSVMVAAPTGSGKTVVAEYGIYASFRGTGRVLYTAPIKALSNQKFRDLRAVYGDEIGLLTGDVTENRDARVLVMTTEILRNMLLQSPWELDDVETVIFDEIHYLADQDRGTTWEESIILCPDHIQLICLSATVTNAEEIAGWIGRTHRPVRLVTHTARPVPLALYFFHEDQLHPVVDHYGEHVGDFSRVGGEMRRQRPRGRHGRVAAEVLEPQPHEIVEQLEKQQLLPVIYFLFSRNDCQAFAERLAAMHPLTIQQEDQDQIEHILQTYLESLREEDRQLDQVRVIQKLARKGIGFHHAGLLPVLKQLVEVLFSRGLMQVVFATDTLALGVNMPARTVVVGRMSKWDGRQKRTLIPNEFQQMAGRAGRRGMDAFGHVVMLYSPWIPFREMLPVAIGPLLPVQSAFAIRYNTVLNLWDPPEGDRVRQMLQRSLAQYQSNQRTRIIEQDILEVSSDLHGVPHGCLIGHPDGDDLLDDYSMQSRLMQALQTQVRRARRDLKDVETATETASPWPRPTRQAIRRAFRTASPGLLMHHQEEGWLAFLGKTVDGVGTGLSLTDATTVYISEYRHIDYLTETTVAIPVELHHPPTIDDARVTLENIDRQALLATLRRADVPNVDEVLREHRESEWTRRRDELERLEQARDVAQEELANAKNAREDHVCHSCEVRKEHRRYQRLRDNLERERTELVAGLERQTLAEDLRIRNIIRGIRDVLHRFDYLRQGYPTAKADMLADIFDNDGLILCELIDRGLLDALSADELAELFSWYSFDREYRYPNHSTLPTSLIRLKDKLEDLERDIIGEERDHQLYISQGHNPGFYGAALAWCRGSTMQEIGAALQLSEGDLVITFNKTIDLLRQVRDMLTDVQPDHPLREQLTEAIRRLKRGIVEQSLTLGFTPIADMDDATDDIEPELGFDAEED